MFTASAKRKENVAEYILYMWQIEDMIRAYKLDIEKIKTCIIDRYTGLTDAQKKELTEWYESLIDMMRQEGVEKSGHLQLSKNVMSQLVELHQALLKDPRFQDYTALFYKTLPYIVEIRGKAGSQAVGEIETCFTALYGMLLLRLQKKEISKDTEEAVAVITKFISTLAKHFHLDRDKIEEGA